MIVDSDREVPAVFFSTEKYPGTTVTYSGVVCDQDGRPLPKLKLQVVRFEGSLGPTTAPEYRHFEAKALKKIETRDVVSSQKGLLTIRGLKPGQYALMPIWEELSGDDVEKIIFDLVESYSVTMVTDMIRPE